MSLLGVEDIPKDARLGQCGGGIEYESGECAQCMDQSCCSEIAACEDDSSCARIMGCRNGCAINDAVCRIGCGDDSGLAERTPLANVEQCRRESCNDACLGCGDYGDLYGAECAAALDHSCSTEQAVAHDSTADRVVKCLEGCNDPICRFVCASIDDQESYDIGVSYVEAFNNGCDLSSDWQCVCNYPSGVRIGDGCLHYSVELHDLHSNDPLEGIEVVDCDDSKPATQDCPDVGKSALTDASGFATISLHADTLNGFSGAICFNDKRSPKLMPDQGIYFPNLFFSRVDYLQMLNPTDTGSLELGPIKVALLVSGECRNRLASQVQFKWQGVDAGAGMEEVVHYLVDDTADAGGPPLEQTSKLGAAYSTFLPPNDPSNPVHYQMLFDQEVVGEGSVWLLPGRVMRTFARPGNSDASFCGAGSHERRHPPYEIDAH